MHKIRVAIHERSVEATDVVKLELRPADGGVLPAFAPGAHIDLFLPNGLTRQYSLLNDGEKRNRYEIAVSKASASRGGSSCVHADLNVGMQLNIGPPRNNFPLDSHSRRALFIAGGIGITPILSMIRHFHRNCMDWRLLYLARTRSHAAFRAELLEMGSGRVEFHFDDEVGRFFDFNDGQFNAEAGVSIYCCGPGPLMTSVQTFAAARLIPAYFEWFAPPKDITTVAADRPFDVKLRSSGRVLRVPEGRSILEVLEGSGLELPFSCREGMCRTCEVRVVEGIPDHRDHVLSKIEQEAGITVMICVSRSKTAALVLDI
jgi:tetrachlorobenzoquinone reductase